MHEQRMPPYIGVTGFMTHAEVDLALGAIPWENGHKLMVGVLMSSKTLAGEPNKWPGRYPPREDVENIFTDDPKAINLIHYSTDDPETLSDQLEQIVDHYAGPHLNGFQLNIRWPPVEEVGKFWSAHTDLFLVLQVGKKALRAVDAPHSLVGLSDAIAIYEPRIDAVLIDPSGGKGQFFDPVHAAFYLGYLSQQHPDLNFGVAGGFEARQVKEALPSLLEVYPNLSIDAEGRLRDERDRLATYAMQQYLRAAWFCIG